MATQEIDRPLSLPPYPEMIMAALDALNEPMGSNKTSISNFIESKYPNLPPGHATLLKHHLNRMKDSGQLIFWKNNYMKPRPDFIRRGRGRPPKSKEPGMPTPAGSAKPKARPRKDEMDSASGDPSGESVQLKKKKISPDNGEQPTKTGRGRGRPPKAKPTMATGGEGVSTQA
ncbi:HMG-Y-related protein A-like [Silene latifolia]|uniref:HMG-Y-related protein A-like n=1 Tax=Silene latifolia TaxID=37657 RepID=UPI003D783FDE